MADQPTGQTDAVLATPLTEFQRLAIMTCAVTATILSTLDMTIANVALPQMQGGLSASQGQMTWILTSYIVASAMAMPLSGWLASALSRRTLLLGSIIGFIIASAFCGVAQNLTQIVIFRTLQGIFGASLVPISQSLMLDVAAPGKQATAMALWTAGALIGPTAGPIVGGYLTDALNWRWVFYINVPIGIATVAGLWLYMPRRKMRDRITLDLQGYLFLSVGVGCLQLMLDRGETAGWFESLEIQIEALISLISFYLFFAHSATTKNPFFSSALVRDRNFALGTLLSMVFGMVMYANIALAPTLQQQLLNYPVMESGLISTPRGFAAVAATFLAAFLMRRGLDGRWLIGAGFLIFGLGCFILSRLSLDTDSRPIILGTGLQGFAAQLAFVPLSTAAFSTLDARYRNEGAALFAVVRNIGGGCCISIMQSMLVQKSQVMHSYLMEHIRADNPMVAQLPQMMSPDTPAGAALLNGFVTRQAAMVAYLDNFYLLGVLSVVLAPFALFIRYTKSKSKVEIHVE